MVMVLGIVHRALNPVVYPHALVLSDAALHLTPL